MDNAKELVEKVVKENKKLVKCFTEHSSINSTTVFKTGQSRTPVSFKECRECKEKKMTSRFLPKAKKCKARNCRCSVVMCYVAMYNNLIHDVGIELTDRYMM